MNYDIIRKQLSGTAPKPNLGDYAAVRAGFSWQQARQNWMD